MSFKGILVALVCLFSVSAFADDFACEIRSDSGKYAVTYSGRGNTAIVGLDGYYCSGSTNRAGWVKAYLYEPGETDDDDATKSDTMNDPSTSATVSAFGYSCTCGIM